MGNVGVDESLGLVYLGEAAGHVFVLFPEQQWPPVDQGDLRAKRAKEVGHLGGNVATTHDGQAWWLLRQSERFVGSDVGDEAQAGKVRDRRPRASGDNYRLGADFFALHLKRLFPDEPTFALENGDVG